MSEWQDISTAPKDGTRVLLFDNSWIVIGSWNTAAEFGNFENGPGWQIFECEGDDFFSIASDTPTHWQPLPSPPKAA